MSSGVACLPSGLEHVFVEVYKKTKSDETLLQFEIHPCHMLSGGSLCVPGVECLCLCQDGLQALTLTCTHLNHPGIIAAFSVA